MGASTLQCLPQGTAVGVRLAGVLAPRWEGEGSRRTLAAMFPVHGFSPFVARVTMNTDVSLLIHAPLTTAQRVAVRFAGGFHIVVVEVLARRAQEAPFQAIRHVRVGSFGAGGTLCALRCPFLAVHGHVLPSRAAPARYGAAGEVVIPHVVVTPDWLTSVVTVFGGKSLEAFAVPYNGQEAQCSNPCHREVVARSSREGSLNFSAKEIQL